MPRQMIALLLAAFAVTSVYGQATVVAVAQGSTDHTVLVDAVVAAGLADTLSGAGPFTVFAPTNAAFTAALTALGVTAEQLLANPQLGEILTYHVVPSLALASGLSDGMTVATVQGEMLTIGVSGSTVTVTDAAGNVATVTAADLTADNGVVHVVDAVLLPSTFPPPATVVAVAQGSTDHTVLVDAVVAASLADTLSGAGPYTVFAPTNAAFTAALTALGLTAEQLLASPSLGDILTYHVVPVAAYSSGLTDGMTVATVQGEMLTIGVSAAGVTVTDAAGNVATVTAADLYAGNGVVHVVDAVLLPSTFPPPATVVAVAQGSTAHTVLVDAVVAASLADTLSGAGPYTVFAPTNAAFTAALTALGLTAEQLLASPSLGDILTYHVVPVAAYSSGLTDGMTVATVQGEMLTIGVSAAGVTVTDSKGTVATVTAADLYAGNGVVHVVDAVLLPSTFPPPPPPPPAAAPATSGATSVRGTVLSAFALVAGALALLL